MKNIFARYNQHLPTYYLLLINCLCLMPYTIIRFIYKKNENTKSYGIDVMMAHCL